MFSTFTEANDSFSLNAVRQHATDLGSHLRECKQARGRLFWVYRFGERLHQTVAPRLYTTAFSAAAALYLVSVWS
jgi:hypothetical protein